jgi:hypothetical protein
LELRNESATLNKRRCLRCLTLIRFLDHQILAIAPMFNSGWGNQPQGQQPSGSTFGQAGGFGQTGGP